MARTCHCVFVALTSYLYCPKGYTGNTCETDIDDCVNHNCSNGGSCIDGVNNYSCNCLQGFTGGLCETDIDDCVNHSCSNGGSCEDGVNSYSCNCPGGYTGGYCETDIDYCINHTCQNGGSCVDGLHNYSCKCPVGYTGSNCITETSSTATTIASPTSSATRGTSSVQPTTGQPETKFVVELRIQRTWNDDLENENSEAFKELSQILVIQISEQYSQEDNFVRVETLSFRPGSVLAQFQLLFKNEIGDERALTPLKRAVLDGKLGSLTVDPESLKIMRDFEEPTKEDKGKVPYPLIIGASCGGVFFLAILIICLIRYCHRRKMESRRRVLGVLPGERAFPNSKKYELQEIKSEEDHARYEEIGMWKDKVSYKEIPISQDAARYEKLKLSNSAIYQELQDTPNVDCDYEEIHTSNDALRHQETSLL